MMKNREYSSLLAELLVYFAAFIPKVILFPLFQMVGASIWINIVLAVFNLLPIPPLDGSKVLMGMLPPRQSAAIARLEPFGFLILLALFYTGFLQKVLMPIIALAERMISGQ